MDFPELKQSAIKNIMKMKAGESVTGVFRGEVYTFKSHWNGSYSSACDGADCKFCANNNKPKTRFRLNFVTKENAVLVAKVFEQGYKTMQDLKELNKEYPLEKHWVKITRTGNSASDTKYTILPIKNSELTKAQEAEIAKIQLNILDPVSALGASQAASATDAPEEDEIPF